MTGDVAKLQLRCKTWPLLGDFDAHGRSLDLALMDSKLPVDDYSGIRKDDDLWGLPCCSLGCAEGDEFAHHRQPGCGSRNMNSTLLVRWQNSDQLPRTATDKTKSYRGWEWPLKASLQHQS